MKPPEGRREKRIRLAPEARRLQIIEAAGKLVLQQGHLPLPLEALAQSAGVSKALIYAYFRDQHALFNAVLGQEFEVLAARGLVEASQHRELRDASLGCALIYFEHVVERGPLIHVVLRDPYMAGRVAPSAAAFRDLIVRRLGRLAQTALRLGVKETIAAINMVITIPEEAGRLVHTGALPLVDGRALCSRLVGASLEAFSPSAP